MNLAVRTYFQFTSMGIAVFDYDVSELTVISIVVDCTGRTCCFSVVEYTVNHFTVVCSCQPVKTSTVGT
jgi:hypothetical protein